MFDAWTDSEVKSYLDSYGIPSYQGTTPEQIKAEARKHATYFKYGTSSPSESIFARIQEGAYWLLDQIKIGAGIGQAKGQEAADTAASKAAEATDRAKSEL